MKGSFKRTLGPDDRRREYTEEEALVTDGTEELKRLHVFSQAKLLVWDTTPVQPKPLDSTAFGLGKLQVHWTETRSKMFQMLKENNPKPSSAEQAEFVADFYAHARGRTR